MSLSVLGDVLEVLDRIPEAIPNDEEALRVLTPYFLRRPAAFAGAIASYARDYIRRCELASRDPDVVLLGPIAEKLSDESKVKPANESTIEQP
jgi:hypothetical protein